MALINLRSYISHHHLIFVSDSELLVCDTSWTLKHIMFIIKLVCIFCNCSRCLQEAYASLRQHSSKSTQARVSAQMVREEKKTDMKGKQTFVSVHISYALVCWYSRWRYPRYPSPHVTQEEDTRSWQRSNVSFLNGFLVSVCVNSCGYRSVLYVFVCYLSPEREDVPFRAINRSSEQRLVSSGDVYRNCAMSCT